MVVSFFVGAARMVGFIVLRVCYFFVSLLLGLSL